MGHLNRSPRDGDRDTDPLAEDDCNFTLRVWDSVCPPHILFIIEIFFLLCL